MIASQAVITGAFSVSRQALQMGFLPRMYIQHTSESTEGQIYMPRVNWGLMIATMLLVISFGSSDDLAAAYGIAVTGDMIITSLLAAIVFHEIWKWSKLRTAILISVFLIIDLTFFSANVLKIPDGGWIPIMIGVIIFTLMFTWKTGRSVLYRQLKQEEIKVNPFIESLDTDMLKRVEGTAIFLTPNAYGIPRAMLHNIKHNKVLHEHNVILTVCFLDYPHTSLDERVIVEKLPEAFYRVTINYGFMDEPNLPRDLLLCKDQGLDLEPMQTSFFIGKDILITSNLPGLSLWRKKIFVVLFRSAETITNQLKLPPNRVVELGAQVKF